MCYDPLRRRTVLFGGSLTFVITPANDTWEFDGSNWTQVATPTSPPDALPKSMIYDARRNRVVMLGEAYQAYPRTSLWDYDGSDWTRLLAQSLSPNTTGHDLLQDPRRGVLSVLAADGSLWTLSGGTLVLTRASLYGVVPQVAAYDPTSGRILAVYTGQVSGAQIQLWQLHEPDLASWTRYGIGCPGSNGTPSLDGQPNVPPALGTTFPMQLSSLPTRPGLALFVFGTDFVQWGGTLLPAPLDSVGLTGCSLWLAPSPAMALLAHGGSTSTTPLVIPAAPALAGVALGIQAFVFDPASTSGLGAVSNGLILRLY